MPTLAELVADVRVVTENLPADIDAKVSDYVRTAQDEAEERHIFLVMETALEATTTLATRKLADRPALWLRRLDRPYWVHGVSGAHGKMAWASSAGQLLQRYGAGSTAEYRGAPMLLLETSTELHVYPFPDQLNPVGAIEASGNYPIVVPYATRLDALDLDGATNWFSEQAADYLVARASAEAFFATRDYDAAAIWSTRAKSYLDRAIRLDKRARFHLAETLEPLHGANARAGQARGWR